MKNKNKPDGAVIDIETYPTEVLMYGNIYEPVVVKIVKPGQILSMSWRKVGENKTHYIGQNSFPTYKPGKLDDKNLVKSIIEILKDFDYVVGHNSDQFDIKTIKERILFHRLKPLSDLLPLDTKKLIKGISRLPSNKLQHVSEFLNNGGKMPHQGVDTFLGCGAGNKEDWKINEVYNKRDVDITHDDFIDMLPYAKLPNIFSRMNTIDINCSNLNCLSNNLVKHKRTRSINGWKQQYQCKDCGRYTTDTRIMKE